jgi:DNA-binding transcriptional LysR family regulator
MPHTDLNDIVAFFTVARGRGLNRAGAQLGVSQSALSQTVRGPEARLGLRRLTHTTPRVAHDHAVQAVLWPAQEKRLPYYPAIKVEIVIDYDLTDIVAKRCDAGIRSGEIAAKDMVAMDRAGYVLGCRCSAVRLRSPDMAADAGRPDHSYLHQPAREDRRNAMKSSISSRNI